MVESDSLVQGTRGAGQVKAPPRPLREAARRSRRRSTWSREPAARSRSQRRSRVSTRWLRYCVTPGSDWQP